VITSRANPRLKRIRRLRSARHRRETGLFVVEGEDLVEAALEAGLAPVDLLRVGEDVQPELLAEVSTLPHPPRVVAVFRSAELPALGSQPVGLALWHVSDPGNVGTLIRSADALGPAFVALSAGCGDPLGEKALRASAGALVRVPLCGFDDAPGRRIALVARGGEPLPEVELTGSVVFVLGAERAGLPAEVLAACDALATIPQAAGESLNVATAGAIALYERARRSVPGTRDKSAQERREPLA
jgi:TrmH family RNA methyltransferase